MRTFVCHVTVTLSEFTVKLSVHEKERLSHLSQQLARISLILVEKLGKTFTDVPKFVLRLGSKSQNSSHPSPSPPHWGFRVSFLPSTRGSNVGRSFVSPLSSHRGPKLESADGVLDFELVGIPPFPTHLLQIS
ncbi:hypothetical protein AVEN_179714-1 [Araneus ventricosus]|uniref:Uncharacterized protein n=1 Tax=Araneus ventricosus TaxID=182803 RepID=A0A4Y2K1L0_ARAVE|nr:hypothetical protein AVEN_231145-1 [Araneus ventricosus]GBM96068.1 hypothetical protein AVEN_73759-1 [Araneus ventricosus]GBM96210.1 hypothetical protein AVEN_232359-1 [Araneus ventricosus]GBM96250.1 hypothetical protein AVEN_179714-1 [Araneus ventricosus]